MIASDPSRSDRRAADQARRESAAHESPKRESSVSLHETMIAIIGLERKIG
jgi:hypothetical protein